MLRDHGSDQKYLHTTLGHNYRMEGIQGAVLGVKLKYLDTWTDARRNHAARYARGLAGLADVKLPQEMPYARHVYHLYVIRTPERDRLQKFLGDRGIATGLHYPVPLHLQQVFSELGYKEGDLPVAEALSKEILSLPMFAELTDDQIDYTCTAIREFFN
jgi:dTDP-4-amino-4,6-dideoxygalactose transaminase